MEGHICTIVKRTLLVHNESLILNNDVIETQNLSQLSQSFGPLEGGGLMSICSCFAIY